jgi:Cu-Zn family superoxide dismutase
MVARSVIAIALIAVCALVNVNAGAYFGICTFQQADTINGYFTFQQEELGLPVTVVANFSTSIAAADLYLHVHTYGDLDADDTGACWVADSIAGPFTSSGATAFLQTSYYTGLDFYGGDSVIGRSMHLYAGVSDCETSATAQPLASCVVGTRNVLEAATNIAGVFLDEMPVSGFAKFVGTIGQYGDHSDVTGRIFFVPLSDGDVYVDLEVSGFAAQSVHALHVHAWGDIHSGDGLSAGVHFNPYGMTHGYPPSWTRHMGDCGNVTSNDDGVIAIKTSFNLLALVGFQGNILGHGIIIHTLGDDGNPLNTTESTGAAGGRIAKGVIGISSRLPDGFVDTTAATTTLAKLAKRAMSREVDDAGIAAAESAAAAAAAEAAGLPVIPEDEDVTVTDDASVATEESTDSCEAGTYVDGDECVDCPLGRYSVDTDSSICSRCLAGTYQDETGQSSCIECSAGTYYPYTGAISVEKCYSCAEGLVSAAGASTCMTPDELKALKASSLVREVDDAGIAAAESAAAAAAAEAAGLPVIPEDEDLTDDASVATEESTDSCEAGTYVDGDECVDCPLGRYSVDTDSSICSRCLAGSYQDETGQTSCIECSAGTYYPYTGAISVEKCYSCAEGLVSATGASECMTPDELKALKAASATTASKKKRASRIARMLL